MIILSPQIYTRLHNTKSHTSKQYTYLLYNIYLSKLLQILRGGTEGSVLKCGSTTRARALSTAYRSNRQWASNAGDGITRLDLRAYRSNRQWASNAGDGITRLDLRAYRSNRQWASNAGDGITRLDLRVYRSNRQWASNAGDGITRLDLRVSVTSIDIHCIYLHI